jgi:hypothetical protein
LTAFHRKQLVGYAAGAETGFIETASLLARNPVKESIMNTTSKLSQALVAAAALLALGAAQAAPQEVVKLPRVVITGKSVATAEPQQIVQLPRVVIVGLSVESQLRQQTLAAAKPARRS